MNAAQRQALLIILAVAIITLAVLVWTRNRAPDDDLIAAAVGLSGVAIVVSILPTKA